MEHDEQVALFNYLARYEQKYPILKWVFAIPNGGKRHPATAVKMKAEGVKAGVWDVFVPFSGWGEGMHAYFGLWVEMKFGKNKLSANQVAFREALGNKYEWAVCYTAEDAARAIGEYLGIQELVDVTRDSHK